MRNRPTRTPGSSPGAGGSFCGNGGNGQGGGFLIVFGVKAVLSDTALLENQAQGGNGGNGQGGGIFNGGRLPSARRTSPS